MPFVACPDCGLEIQIDCPESYAHNQCVQCNVVSGAAHAPQETPFSSQPEPIEGLPLPEPLPSQPRVPVMLIAAALAGLVCVVMAAVDLVPLLSTKPQPEAAVPQATAPATTVPPAAAKDKQLAADPYPECPAIRQWLRDNTGEPDSVQVIKWESRHAEDAGTGIWVKYRAKNEHGGWSVFRRIAVSRNGKVSSTYVETETVHR